RKVEDLSPAINGAPADPLNAAWEVPDADEKLADVVRDEFRIRFAASWAGKIGSSQVLTARRLSSLESANPSQGADSCVWFSGDAGSASRLLSNDPGEPIAYLVTARDQEAQSSASVSFNLNTLAGQHLGTLQC